MFILLVGCTSTNKKMETHPTNNKNALEALDKSDLIPIHFHGFKPLHVDSETTSCYINRKFNKKAKSIIPMAGTLRGQHETDKSIL